MKDPESLLLSIFTSEGRENPHPSLAELRRMEPVHYNAAFGTYFLTRYADCQTVLTSSAFAVPGVEWCAREIPDWRDRPSAEFFYASMLRSNGQDHARLRRLVGGGFSARRFAALRPVVSEIAAELLDVLETALLDAPATATAAPAPRAQPAVNGGATPGADFQTLVGYPLPIAVMSRLIGVSPADQDQFQRLGQDAGRLLEPVRTEEDWKRADSAVLALRAYFAELVRRRRREPADDLASALIAVRDADEGRLGEGELIDSLVLVLVAGFETTASLLGLSVHALLTHRDQWELVCRQPESAEAAVEETLRWDAPVRMTERIALVPSDVGGTTIPAGANVTAVLAAGNRDPERHPAPDTFRVERRDIKVLSFSSGPHFCPGAALARIECAELIRQLTRRFPGLRLAAPPVRRDSVSLRGFESLRLATTAA